MTLAATQLVVARGLGCASWPQLKATVEERLMSRDQRVRAFVLASIQGHADRAMRLFHEGPDLGGADIWTAAVLAGYSQVFLSLTLVTRWRSTNANTSGATCAVQAQHSLPEVLVSHGNAP